MAKIPGLFQSLKTLAETESVAAGSLTLEDNCVIDMQTDNTYVYLPTYIGNEGMVLCIKGTATFSGGIVLYTSNATEYIDGAAHKASGAQYDALWLVAHSQGWHILSKIGTWS